MNRVRDFFEDNWEAVAIGLVAVLALFGLWRVITYRKTQTVQIQVRYWTWEAAVKYDTTSTEIKCTTSETCSGTGTSRTCRTSTDCRPVTHTTTHTRCSNIARSDTQPPYRPGLCDMQRGDYIRDKLVYHISYRVVESDKTGTATFDGARWNELEPGAVVKITMNVADRIVKIEGSKK